MKRIKLEERETWYPPTYKEGLQKEQQEASDQILHRVQRLHDLQTYEDRHEFFLAFRTFLSLDYDLPCSSSRPIAKHLFSWITTALAVDVWSQIDAMSVLQQFLTMYRPIYGLVVPWKPLYDLLMNCHLSPFLLTVPDRHGPTLAKLIVSLRPYFSTTASSEILIEIRHYLCRYSAFSLGAQAALTHFLPSYLHCWVGTAEDFLIMDEMSSSLQQGAETSIVPANGSGARTKAGSACLDYATDRGMPHRMFWMEETMGMWRWQSNADWSSLWLELLSRSLNSPYCLFSPLAKGLRRSMQDLSKKDIPMTPVHTWCHWSTEVEALFQQWLPTQSLPSQDNMEHLVESYDPFVSKQFEETYLRTRQQTDRYSEPLCALMGFPGIPMERLIDTLFHRFSREISSHIEISPFTETPSEYYPEELAFLLNNTCMGSMVSVAFCITHLLISTPLGLTGYDSDRTPFAYLERLLTVLEPYYHPSSEEEWQNKLIQFLKSLCHQFTSRRASEGKSLTHMRKRVREVLTELTDPVFATGENYFDRMRRLFILRWELERQRCFFLQDDDVTHFVKLTKPLIDKAMYAKSAKAFAIQSLHFFSYITPDLIIPDILSRVFYDLETSTQTHRTSTALRSLICLCRTMLSPSFGLLAGPHLEVMLQNTLPGIDPNDPEKTYLTMAFYFNVLCSVPLISSPDDRPFVVSDVPLDENAPSELQDNQQFLQDPKNHDVIQMVLLATRQFHGWALELLERVFGWIELLPAKQHGEDKTLDQLLATMTLLFQQSSDELFGKLMERLFEYSSQNRAPNTRVALASLCGSLAATHPALVLETFFPYYYKQMLSSERELCVTSQDDMIWNLTLLQKIVASAGEHLLPYRPQITRLLQAFLRTPPSSPGAERHLTTKVIKSVYKFLRSVLKCISRTFPLESRSMPPEEWAQATSGDPYALLLRWNYPCPIDDLGITWHIPSPCELEWAMDLVNEFGVDALKQLESFTAEEAQALQFRRTLRESLHLIRMCYQGLGELLLQWPSPPHEEQEYTAQFGYQPSRTVFVQPTLPPLDHWPTDRLQFTYERMLCVLHRVAKVLLGENGQDCDDAKTLKLLIRTMGTVLSSPYGFRQKQAIKQILKSNIPAHPIHPKSLPRHALILQAALQHLHRIQFHHGPCTSSLWQVMEDLILLSIHPYRAVRTVAQQRFYVALTRFQLPTKVLAQRLIKLWSDPSARDYQVIGCSYLLSIDPIMDVVFESLPICAQFINAVITLNGYKATHKVQTILTGVLNNYECCFIPLPLHIWVQKDKSKPLPLSPEDAQCIQQIVKAIAQKGPKLAWSFQERLLSYLFELIVCQRASGLVYPCVLYEFILQCHFSDVTLIRSSATSVLSSLLKQTRIRRPFHYLRCTLQVDEIHSAREERAYAADQIPSTHDEWENSVLIDRTAYGWNGQHDQRKVYNPLTREEHEELIRLHRADYEYSEYQQLCHKYKTEDSRVLFESRQYLASKLLDESFWRTVLTNWSNEDREEMDPLVYLNFFRQCFAYFPDLLSVLQPLILELVGQVDHPEPQSLAAEIIGGLLRGSKHWPFERLKEMRSFVLDVLDRSLSVPHFKTCWYEMIFVACESRDYRRVEWIYRHFEERLYTVLQNPSLSSLQVTRVIDYLLACASVLTWRGNPLTMELIQRLWNDQTFYDATLLIRTSVGEFLHETLSYFYEGTRHPQSQIPTVQSLTLNDYFLPGRVIQQYYSRAVDQVLQWKATKNPGGEEQARRYNNLVHSLLLTILPERVNALSLTIPLVFPLFPVALLLIDDTDDLLSSAAWKVVGAFAVSEFDRIWMDRLFSLALDLLMDRFDARQFAEVKEGSQTLVCSWRVRCVTLTFLQAFIGHNIFYLDESKLPSLLECLFTAMRHSQVEVRQTASTTFTLIARFMRESHQIQVWDQFVDTIQAYPLTGSKSNKALALIQRHSAVLGMAALVQAHPYDIPSWMPDRLVEFAAHIHDPMPIKSTVRNTFLAFWRVHQDSWATEQEMFTQEQLNFLVELLASPSYFV